jgi:hypothetical protein
MSMHVTFQGHQPLLRLLDSGTWQVNEESEVCTDVPRTLAAFLRTKTVTCVSMVFNRKGDMTRSTAWTFRSASQIMNTFAIPRSSLPVIQVTSENLTLDFSI